MPRQPAVTKEKLIDAMASTMTKYGVKKTTLEDIGRAVGVSKAAVLYHFHSKEELIVAVIDAEYERFLGWLQEGIDRESTAEGKLHAFGFLRFRFIGERMRAYGEVTREILESVMPLVRQSVARNRERELDLLRGILADGMASGEFAPGDPELMAVASLAALSGLYDAFILYDRGDRIAEGLEQLFRLMMNGLRRR